MAIFNIGATGGNSNEASYENTDARLGFFGASASYIRSGFFSLSSNYTYTYSSALNDIARAQRVYTTFYISAPYVSWIGSSAFAYNNYIQEIICPNCTTVYSDAFMSAQGLKTLELTNCSDFQASLYYMSNLQTLTVSSECYVTMYNTWCYSAPELTTVIGGFGISSSHYSAIFASCAKLTGSITFINSYHTNVLISNCATGRSLSLYYPNFIGGSNSSPYYFYTAEYYLTSQIDIYLPKAQYIRCFTTGASKVNIYFNNISAVPTLTSSGSTNLFTSATSIKIYVPSSLYTNFRNATNWTTIKNYIYSI